MPPKFFLTTPIYYINATPHIGHAYTQIAADARARFERLRGKRVLFLTGTDENAAKVARVAQEQGRDPQEFCDELAQAFRDVWDKLGISYDDYIRTTEERHKIVVQRVVEKLWHDGQLELGKYAGWYSVPDETFFKSDETVERDGKTYLANPTEDQSKSPLEWIEETVHFFRLSQFQDSLLEHYELHPNSLQPSSRRNEALAFIGRGLDNTSISRVQSWGIPVPSSVPEHQNHVVYVWFPDALLNYASAPGYLSDDEDKQKLFAEMWPPDLQLMSKDIFTRFHATFWPALLQSLGLEQPKLLFAHGFWTVDGRKMSKRDPETIVEPIAFAQEIAARANCEFEIAVDALRYYCLREVTFGADGDFSREGCFGRYNADLANGLGNLVNRALSMLQQYFDGVVPEASRALDVRRAVLEASPRVEKAYENLEFHTALHEVWDIVALPNRVIEEEKPWAKIKAGDEENRAQVAG
ncbi:MAG TPA: methionine--tRNA ligase, partial [Abditibacteriaceae bacterium]|nr:methionine--tRNA ligase [Abditibacteriaceae bacterium]